MRKGYIYNWTKAVLAVALMSIGIGNAVSAATIRETDVSKASDGMVIVGVEGTYYTKETDEILELINSYRKEAFEEGLIDPATGKQFTSYKPLQWSNSLEGIAQMRASEGMVLMDHTRPNGKGSNTCYSSLLSYYGYEDLAWNWVKSPEAIKMGIEQWYEEKDDYVNKTSGAVTGHYTSMIRSDVSYIGIGCFDVKNDTSSWVCIAGKISASSPSANTNPVEQGIYEQRMEVNASNITELSLGDDIRMAAGETKTGVLKAKITYSDDYTGTNTVSNAPVYDGATWTSSDSLVATVSDKGVVTAKTKGTAVITATVGSKSASVTVTVAEPVKAEALPALMTDAFETPALPESTVVTWSDGETTDEQISWDEDDNDYNVYSGNDYRVKGTVSGFTIYQSIVMARADYVSAEFGDAFGVDKDSDGKYVMNIDYGQKPELPDSINVTWKGHENLTKTFVHTIEWSDIAKAEYTKHTGNEFTVTGTITDVEDENINVTVKQVADSFSFTPISDIDMEAGKLPTLPSKSSIVWSDDVEDVSVTWEEDWQTKYEDKLFAKEANDVEVSGTYTDPVTGVNKAVSVIVRVPDALRVYSDLNDRTFSLDKDRSFDSLPDTISILWTNGKRYEEGISFLNIPGLKETDDVKSALSNIAESVFEVQFTIEDGLEEIYTADIRIPHAYVKSSNTSGVTVEYGVEPDLPDRAEITWSNGTNTLEPVTWDEVAEADYKKHRTHTFTVKGHVGGSQVSLEDASLCEIEVSVTQKQDTFDIVRLADINTEFGVVPKLPAGVSLVWSDESEEVIPVIWENDWDSENADTINNEDGGTFTVTGVIDDTASPLDWEDEEQKTVTVKVTVFPKKQNNNSQNNDGDDKTEKSKTDFSGNTGDGKPSGGEAGGATGEGTVSGNETPGKKSVTDGAAIQDTSTGARYEVNVSGDTVTLTYTGSDSKKETVTIPATVTIDGTSYKVTAIDDGAFKNNKKLKKITIGKNITSIGSSAFAGCKSLKTITIKSTKLTKKSFGKKAFKNINKKAAIKVPKKLYTKYKKWLKNAGVPKTVKIKKS